MMLGSLPVWPFRGSKPRTTLCIPIGMHIEKVVLVQQALETEEQPAMRRKSNKRVVGTCSYILLQNVLTCMVNTATICMYMHDKYCYNMYVHVWSILLQYVHVWSTLLKCIRTGMVNTVVQYVYAWYISRITRKCPTYSLLTTHAHYIRDGFVGTCKGRTTWTTVLLYNFV